MNVVATASNGVVNDQTIFHFHQKNNVISAKYSGGKVINGYLAGRVDKNILRFKYAQKNTLGKVQGGESICQLELKNDGKIELIEQFEWNLGKGIIANNGATAIDKYIAPDFQAIRPMEESTAFAVTQISAYNLSSTICYIF